MQQSFGQGPRDPDHPHGVQQSPGAQQAPGGASGASRPEEQHHKPFFYIQPSQPYLPLQSLQWSVPMPVPVSYNPYYSYPGECRNRVQSNVRRSYNSDAPVENVLCGITQTLKREISVIVVVARTWVRAEAKVRIFLTSTQVCVIFACM